MINKDDIYFLNTNKSVRIKNLIFLNIKKVNLSSGGFGTEATFEVNEEDRLSWSQLMPEFQKNGSIDDLITEHLDRMKSDDESIMIFITSIKNKNRKKFQSAFNMGDYDKLQLSPTALTQFKEIFERKVLH